MEVLHDPDLLVERAEKFALENGILPEKSVLAAYSGGADSSVLLRILCFWSEKYGFSVTAMHVNHGIRGENADRDEAFCRETCSALGIPFVSVRCDVPAYAREYHLGIEEAARKLRYEALRACKEERGIEKIAVAHNLDDNLETILFHLARGAAGAGLSGIAPTKDDLIRPLLFASKAEILSFASANGIEYAEDETNRDLHYTRNFIRHEIVPAITKLNIAAADAAFRAGEQLRRDERFLSKFAAEYTFESDVKTLAALDDAILSRVLRNKAKAAGISSLSYELTCALIALLRRNAPLASVSVSKDIDAVVENGHFFFGKRPVRNQAFPPYYKRILKLGENPIPESDSFFLLADTVTDETLKIVRNLQNVYKLFIRKSLVFDNIVGSLFVRPRMPSDRYRINGINKSVKKYMCDEGLAPVQRFTTPFLCDDNGIVWIPGLRERDGLHPHDDDTPLLTVYYFQNSR